MSLAIQAELNFDAIETATEIPAAIVETSTPPIASPDDIPFDFARRAYSWLSFDPDKRAHADRAEYVQDVNGLHSAMLAKCKTDDQRAILAVEIERYRVGYLKRRMAILSTRSRIASPMVTGPANFPVARNRKRMDVEHKRLNEFLDWSKRARAAIERAILDARTPETKTDDRWAALHRDFEGSLDIIDGIDRKDPEWRGWTRSSFVNSIVGKVERLAQAGEVDLVDRSLDLVRAYNAEHKKPAISARHKFWAFGELAESSAAQRGATSEPETIHDADGIQIIRNPALDRVQIVFPGKPDPAMRDRLKSEGWNWSPREMAWQRKATNAAIYSARRILGITS